MNDLVTLGIAWIIGAVVVFAVGAAVWFVRELRNAPTEVPEYTPIDNMLDGPEKAFKLYGWTETAPGVWESTFGPAQLADDEFPLEDIHLDADALAMAGSVLADIEDLPTTEEAS